MGPGGDAAAAEEGVRRAALKAVLAGVLCEDGCRLDHCQLTVQVSAGLHGNAINPQPVFGFKCL